MKGLIPLGSQTETIRWARGTSARLKEQMKISCPGSRFANCRSGHREGTQMDVEMRIRYSNHSNYSYLSMRGKNICKIML